MSDGKGTDTTEVNSSQTKGATAPAGNSSKTSADKVTNNSRKTSKLGEKIAQAEAETAQNPTDAQKKAGNYKKGHVQIGTFDVTIENPKGSVRSGVDANGHKWETEMHNTYGYIRGTESVDGDHIDVFLADDIDSWDGRKVFVIDQYNEDGSFDEHKVMFGFNDAEDAYAAYLSNYEKGWENTHKIVNTPANLDGFEKWINSSHRKTKAFAEYSSVKAVERNNELDALRGKLEKLEEEWNDKILDYVAEHYPTQATVSGYTTSTEGREEMEAMKNDETLKKMKAQAKAEIDAADKRIMAKRQAERDGKNLHKKSLESDRTAVSSSDVALRDALVGRSLTEQEATELVDKMENTAEAARTIELTHENWIAQFGENGLIETPIGEVKMGENQFMKLFSRKRTEYFGMIKPTLTNPDVIIEKPASAEGAERGSKLLFVKTFTKPDGSRVVHFESITVKRDGMEISISSHEAEGKAIKKRCRMEKSCILIRNCPSVLSGT